MPRKNSADDDFIFESDFNPDTGDSDFDFAYEPVKEVKNIKPRKPDKVKAKKSKKSWNPKAVLGITVVAVALIFTAGIFIIGSLNKPKTAITEEEPIAETIGISQVMSAAQKVSKSEFKEILKNSGYDEEEIEQMLETDTSVDWKQNAIDRAELYIENVGTNEVELRKNLDELGFTPEEIEAAIESVKDTDWKAQAVKRGQLYLEKHVITKEQMVEILKEDGFTEEESGYAAENLPCDIEE